MVRFYPNASDTTASGSFSYVQTLLRINYQYFLTGLIEIQYGLEQQLVILVSEGREAGTFHLSGNNCTPVDPGDIQSYWKSGNGSIRTISLPRPAVRAARQVLEWSPPAQTLQAESREVLIDYIETCKAQRANGLFHLLWPRSEGYLNMYFGKPLALDSVFSLPTGTEAGASCLDLILENRDSPCRITFLESRPNSSSYQLQILRTALSELLKDFLGRYSRQLGPGMTKALESDINSAMRVKSWFIQLAGGQFEDTHIFSDLNQALEAYQVMMKHITVHMYNAAGKTETHAMLARAYHAAQPQLQQVIQKYALLPAAATVQSFARDKGEEEKLPIHNEKT